MNADLVRDLAAILEQPAETAEKALALRLSAVACTAPVEELLALGARARASRASVDELRLALGALLALHAGPAGALAR